MRITAAILAAGKGTRFGSDKVLANLRGKPVWRWSFEMFALYGVDEIVVVASPDNIEAIRADLEGRTTIVLGGETRQDSSRIAAETATGDIVLIHDAARPLVSWDTIHQVVEEVRQGRAAAPALPVSDTVRQLVGDRLELLDRSRLFGMQTPQGALRAQLLQAHSRSTQAFTDELGLLESAGFEVCLTEGSPTNFKITTADDLVKARGVVGFTETRTGLGYDVHAFSTDLNRPMMLGGVEFDGPGLEGHSDADVLLHAATDAILGAAGLGDIGVHFPNTDPRWKDKPSLHFLRHAANLVLSKGWFVTNLDISVIAERPKIMARAGDIRKKIAEAMGVDVERVSVKATTNERLGAIGREEGIAAFAVATIREA